MADHGEPRGAGLDSDGCHAGDPQESKDAYAAAVPMSRMGKPEDVAEAVAYLASDGRGSSRDKRYPSTGEIRCTERAPAVRSFRRTFAADKMDSTVPHTQCSGGDRGHAGDVASLRMLPHDGYDIRPRGVPQGSSEGRWYELHLTFGCRATTRRLIGGIYSRNFESQSDADEDRMAKNARGRDDGRRQNARQSCSAIRPYWKP